MIAYICKQIIDGTLDYTYATTKRPDLEEDIDNYLTTNGHADRIV